MRSEPLIVEFHTESGNHYIYDVLSNNVYPVEEVDLAEIYNNLGFISSNAIKHEQRILDRVSQKKSRDKVAEWKARDSAFFPNRKIRAWEFLSRKDYDKELLNLHQLTLEVTQKCNLRCKYCIYSDYFKQARYHGNQNMSWQIAKKSIDYYINVLKSSGRISVIGNLVKAPLGFYGGEPLLNMELIEKCVSYAKSIVNEDKLFFHMTTNLTALNEKIAKFLISNSVVLLVSLDGPEIENDNNRVYRNGAGTFNDVFRNLKLIYKMNKEYFKSNVTFNAVQTRSTNLSNVINFILKFNNDIGKEAGFRFSFDVTDNYRPSLENHTYDKEYLKWFSVYVSLKKKKRRTDQEAELLRVIRGIYEMPFSLLADRCYLNPFFLKSKGGICIPGSRKLYVDVKGNYHMCERIDTSFIIGDCWSGVDYNKVKIIYDNFRANILNDCSNCIAMNLCNICFAAVGINGKFVKEQHCERLRISLKERLRIYYSILEKNCRAFENAYSEGEDEFIFTT